jgi:hypothetical protein
MSRNKRLEFIDSLLTVDVKNSKTVSRRKSYIGRRPLRPPLQYLGLITGSGFETAFDSGVLTWRFAARFATRTRAVDD